MTKRIFNVPTHIDELKIVLWNRFGTLKTHIKEPGKLSLQGEFLSDKNGNAIKFVLATSDDLANFVYISNDRGVCPRIYIQNGNAINSTIVQGKLHEFLALPVGGPKDERMSWGLYFS